MKLVSVYRRKDAAKILYDLLRVRDPSENISHDKMPGFARHKKFVKSAPYSAWYLVVQEWPAKALTEVIGATYLTFGNEIGVHLFPAFRGKRLELEIISLLVQIHSRPFYLTNVNPANAALKHALASLKFRHIQNTYRFP